MAARRRPVYFPSARRSRRRPGPRPSSTVAESVPRPRQASELPDLPHRSDPVPHRDLDADHGAGVAGARADQQALPRRARRDGDLHSDPRLHHAGRGARRPVGQAAARADRPGRLPARGHGAVGSGRHQPHHDRIAPRARLPQRADRVDRDSGAPIDVHRSRRPRRSARSDRPQLERVQPRARCWTGHRRGGDRRPWHRVVLLPQRRQLRRRAGRVVHDRPARAPSTSGARPPLDRGAAGDAVHAADGACACLDAHGHRLLHPRRARAGAHAGGRARHVPPRRGRLRAAALLSRRRRAGGGALAGGRGLSRVADADAARGVDGLADAARPLRLRARPGRAICCFSGSAAR